jgi:hypothetical protein
MIMEDNIVFALFEIYNERDITVLDIYKDWDTAEQARVGLEIYKESGMLSYQVVEYTLK